MAPMSRNARPLSDGGRDLASYLFPIASGLARGVAQPLRPQDPRGVMARNGPGPVRTGRGLLVFSTRRAGSSGRPTWKRELHDRLVQPQVTAVRSGLAAMELSLMAGPGRHRAQLAEAAPVDSRAESAASGSQSRRSYLDYRALR